ncbi:MAG TPA: sporulation protein YabP [Clostridiales bacterium]|nr:sporulation protein YabP [Clostridiales bacterium]
MEERQSLNEHKLIVNSRESIIITGVNDVLSFDAKEVLLHTEYGALMIRGSELHVKRLTLEKGEIDLDGKVDSIMYSDNTSYKKSSETLLNRLFK